MSYTPINPDPKHTPHFIRLAQHLATLGLPFTYLALPRP